MRNCTQTKRTPCSVRVAGGSHSSHTDSGCLGRDSWRGPPVEVCPGFELIAIENAAALGHDLLELSKRPDAQMIRHMRHGSPPRLMALQPILSPNRRESLPTPSAGDRMTGMLLAR